MCYFLSLILLFLTVAFPAAAQESTPDVAALPLTETHTTENGFFSFSYPQDWAITTQSSQHAPGLSAVVASTPDVLYANFATDFAPGDVQIVLVVWYQSTLDSINVHSPSDLLEYLTDPGLSADSIASGEIESTTVNGLPAAQVHIQPQEDQEGSFLAFQLHELLIATVDLYTASGELSQRQPTALAIAESITYNPTPATPEPILTPELTETYATGDGRTSFNFPAGWYARARLDTAATVANTIPALNRLPGQPFAPGEVQVTVRALPVADTTGSPDSTTDDVLELIIDGFSDDPTIEIASTDDAHLNDRATISVILRGSQYETQIWVSEPRPGIVAVVRLTTAPGELPQWQPTAQAIVQSVTYTP